MKVISPPFGMISGFWTSMGLLPHILTLCLLLLTGSPPLAFMFMFLLIFTIGARLLGEWLFWKSCGSRLDSEVKLKNWRATVNLSLLDHPNVIVALLMILVDGVVDVTLLYTASKTSIPILWGFLTLLGCQVLSSPIQGLLSDCFSQKMSLIFAGLIAITVLLLSNELFLDEKIQEGTGSFLLNLIGLSSFTTTVQMLVILGVKGLFGNITVIARAAIAEVIKVETLEKSV